MNGKGLRHQGLSGFYFIGLDLATVPAKECRLNQPSLLASKPSCFLGVARQPLRGFFDDFKSQWPIATI
jgi:hypothetical protein